MDMALKHNTKTLLLASVAAICLSLPATAQEGFD